MSDGTSGNPRSQFETDTAGQLVNPPKMALAALQGTGPEEVSGSERPTGASLSGAGWVGAKAPQADVDALAGAMWDAHEARDPSGPCPPETCNHVEGPCPPVPIWWEDAEHDDLWPAGRRDMREEAKLVLELLARPEPSTGSQTEHECAESVTQEDRSGAASSIDGEELKSKRTDAPSPLEVETSRADQLTHHVERLTREIQAERERREGLEEALRAFARPRATSRLGDGAEHPERDTLRVEVTVADWMVANALLGHMDAEYLRSLPSNARPSEEFIQRIAALSSLPQDPPGQGKDDE